MDRISRDDGQLIGTVGHGNLVPLWPVGEIAEAAGGDSVVGAEVVLNRKSSTDFDSLVAKSVRHLESADRRSFRRDLARFQFEEGIVERLGLRPIQSGRQRRGGTLLATAKL